MLERNDEPVASALLALAAQQQVPVPCPPHTRTPAFPLFHPFILPIFA